MVCGKAMELMIRLRCARLPVKRNAIRAQLRAHTEKCESCNKVMKK